MLTLSKIKKALKIKNYVHVPIGLSKHELLNAAEDFLFFLTLPENIKQKFYLKINPLDRGSTVGYLRKSSEAGDLDDKEYFHYNLLADTEFAHLLRLGGWRASNFISSARLVYLKSVSALRPIMTILEDSYPGIYGKFFPLSSDPLFYLRFVKYNSAEKGRFLAKGHYDRGGCTLALAESAPGLRIGRNEDNLRAVRHKENKVLFFPGLHFPELTGGEFGPAWHDVVQKSDKTPAGFARWAMVFFANAHGLHLPTFEEAHTPKV